MEVCREEQKSDVLLKVMLQENEDEVDRHFAVEESQVISSFLFLRRKRMKRRGWKEADKGFMF